MTNLVGAVLEGPGGLWIAGGLVVVLVMFGWGIVWRSTARAKPVSAPQMTEPMTEIEAEGKATVETAGMESIGPSGPSNEGIRIVTPMIESTAEQAAIPDLAQLALQQAMKSTHI